MTYILLHAPPPAYFSFPMVVGGEIVLFTRQYIALGITEAACRIAKAVIFESTSNIDRGRVIPDGWHDISKAIARMQAARMKDCCGSRADYLHRA